MSIESLDAYFGAVRVVRDVSFVVQPKQVVAIIGPSGCGKSTLLRCINRMHETVPTARVEGEIRFEGRDIYGRGVSPAAVRRHIGMVFQRPTPFPTMSIRDNVAAGLAVLPEASVRRGVRPTTSSSARCAVPRSGKKRKTGCRRAPSRSRAVSSSVFASRARSRRRRR